MLKIFDKNHSAIGHLVKYRDCVKESDVSTGDKTLSFTYLAKHHKLENEMYIQTREDEYVIKDISEDSDGFPQVVAVLNLEELEAKPWKEFSVTDATIDEAARLVLAGTGWTIGECSITKRRNAGMVRVNSLGVIRNLCTAFMCEPVFDTINKKISFYEQVGEDKGVYFMSGLNLKRLQKKSTSYDYYTRIIPIGSDGLTIESVNDGKDYLENYQYSDKVLAYIWEDSSYTDPQALKEDAGKKLEDLSKPEVAYSVELRDLAKQKPEYSLLSYKLGDTITLIDVSTGTREKQRIKRLVEYERDPEKNTCEIANTFLTFEEMQEKLQAAAEIVNYTITNDGKIHVSDILKFEQGLAGSSTVAGINGNISAMQGDLAELKGKYGSLEVNFLTAEEAELKYATIANLNVTNETVHSIQGDYAAFKTTTTQEFSAQKALIDEVSGNFAAFKEGDFEDLSARQADFEDTTTKNLTAANGQINNLSGQFSSFQTSVSQELITAKGWMAEGAIGAAQISSVNANTIDSGILNTAVVNIAGADGRLQIIDNTIQISDENRVRVQIGKDASNDYTLAVWDASGKLIWDALGATENTIQRKIIRDKMVADDAAIQALKIDFQSFETALTQQGVSISGTVVQVGNKTLNVALTEQTQLISDNYTVLADKIDGIEIGGRNLARGTSGEWSEWVTPANNSANQVMTAAVAYLPDNKSVGDEYTVALEIEFMNCSQGTDGAFGFYTQGAVDGVWTIKNIWANGYPVKKLTAPPKDGVYRYEAVSKIEGSNVNATKFELGFRADYWDGNGKFRWRRVKVEKGNKATDWTPAPEDIENELGVTNATIATHAEKLSDHDTRITANESAIKLKVSTQEYESYKTTVTGAISTAKSEAISTAASDATTKANNALASAKTDATTKANNALSDAKVYTNAQITTVNTSLSTTNQEISVIKGQIALKVEQTDIDTAISSIEIGGRNLVSGSGEISVTRNNAANNWISEKVPFFKNTDYGFEQIQVGGQFTLSFDYEITGITTPVSAFPALRRTEGGSYTGIGKYIDLAIGDNAGHFEHTFTPTAEQMQHGTGWMLSGFGAGKNEGAVIILRKIKLQRGNKSTDWQPAPEDIDASITAVDNKFASYSTTAQMQSAITAAKNEINLSVSGTYATKTEVNTVSGNVTTLTSRIATAESKLTKDSLVTTIGSYYATQTYVDGLEYDARNLALGTSSDWMSYSVTDITNCCAVDFNLDDMNARGLQEGDILQISLDLRFSSDFAATGTGTKASYIQGNCNVGGGSWVSIPITGGSQQANIEGIIAGTSKTGHVTTYVKVTKAMVDGTYTGKWSFGIRFNYYKGTVYWRNQMVNKGSKPQMWSPAPEDVDSSITAVETIAAQTSEKFNWLVKSGSSATDFTLTDRTATLIAQTINLQGLVTFSGLDSAAQSRITTAQTTADTAKSIASAADSAIEAWCYDNNRTYINGGSIYTGTVTAATIASGAITTDKLAANAVTAAKINVTDLFAQDITASGTIRGITLEGADIKSLNSSEDMVEMVDGEISLYKTNHLIGSIKPIAQWKWPGGITETPGYYAAVGIYGKPQVVIGSEDVACIAIGKNPGSKYGYSVSLGGSIDIAGDVYIQDEIQSVSANALRVAYGNYGFILRNDGAHTYHLVTAEGDKYGSWNSLRPFYFKNSTGQIYSQYNLSVTSDERDKDIIGAPDERYEKLFMSLEPIAYRWKDRTDTRIQIGLGAQTTERKVLEAGLSPEEFSAVDHEYLSTPLSDGRTEKYSLDYQAISALMIPVLQKTVRFINDQDARITSIASRQDTQESRIELLQQQLGEARMRIMQQAAEIAQLRGMLQASA